MRYNWQIPMFIYWKNLVSAFLIFLAVGLAAEIAFADTHKNEAVSGNSKLQNTDFYLMVTNVRVDITRFCADENLVTAQTKKVRIKKVYTPKSPVMACALGIFPGVAVHGMGHFYIGKGKTGSLLLLLEGLSIAMSTAAIDVNEDGRDNSNGVAGTYGLLLFFGSWVYDFVGAPIKANKMNKEHAVSPVISIEPSRHKTILKLSVA
ncbi:MAG: hypothetical protein GX409_01770, partial [candidate division Zixibacteria bacterium]|nr:hypothetical protein [candidate division Zixibacteria bacterium]